MKDILNDLTRYDIASTQQGECNIDDLLQRAQHLNHRRHQRQQRTGRLMLVLACLFVAADVALVLDNRQAPQPVAQLDTQQESYIETAAADFGHLFYGD